MIYLFSLVRITLYMLLYRTSLTPSQLVETFMVKHNMPKRDSSWQDTTFEGPNLKAQVRNYITNY